MIDLNANEIIEKKNFFKNLTSSSSIRKYSISYFVFLLTFFFLLLFNRIFIRIDGEWETTIR